MAELTIRDLTKRFDRVTAVDDISLKVEEGEFVTLLGPSGCGKTTTLRTIAGFYYPDKGEVRFDEKVMNNVPPNKRSTAMCFQSYALFPHMSVRDNIRFGLKMKKVDAEEQSRRIAEVLAMVGLEGLEDRKPGRLSGGQQQRVALARAIVTQPDILLFDEPLSNLDAKLRVQVRVEIREMQKRLGITTIYVTHDQAEALAISDRIVVMNKGKIEQVGSPYDIYRNPATEFTAGFIGLANIFEGTCVSADNEAMRVKTPFGELTMGASIPQEPGGKFLFSWRPEDVRLCDDASRENAMAGTIQHAIFMGNMNELFVEVGGETVRTQTDNSVTFKQGQPVTFYVERDAFKVLR